MKLIIRRFGPRYLLFALCCTLAAFFTAAKVGAADFVTKAVVGSGNSWSTPLIWSNPPNTTVSAPAAGNTYRLLFNNTAFGNNQGNTRIRNPAAAGVQTFPGDSLTMDANTEIRPKAVGAILNFPGVGGNPGLILNGGALGAGDTAVFEWRGNIRVAADSIMAPGDNGAGAIVNGRGAKFTAALSGSGSLILIQGPIDVASLEVASANNNNFTGNWIVKAGYLKGSAVGALGVGNIIIDPNYAVPSSLVSPAAVLNAGPARFEVTYDHSSGGTLTLANGAVMILHQNVTFGGVTINGTALSNGAHPYSELAANFPANFAAGGSGSITVVPPNPPPAPTGLAVTDGDTQEKLSWSPAPTANSYWVLRGDVSGGPYAPVGNSATTTFTDTGLINGLTYYYVVQGSNRFGAGALSSEVAGHPQDSVRNVVAAGGPGQVSVTWDSLVTASAYTISRATSSGGPYTALASGLTDLSYLDVDVLPGQNYFYVVQADLIAGGQSLPSTPAAAQTTPSAPSSITASLYVSTIANVSWTLSEPAVNQVSVEQSADNVDFTEIALVNGSLHSVKASNLVYSTTYYYRVRAINSGGTSDYSPVASVTTPSFGVHVNFAAGTGNSAGNPVAPIPQGYVQDIGNVYGDQGNGQTYGWDRNLVADGRWRQAANSPDIRYDTFMHMIKAAPPAVWNIAVPNGFYRVHIVGGDPQNLDSTFQYDIEGVTTATYTPTATGNGYWADFTVTCVVSDGQLTVKSGPASQTTANNNKVDFIDIFAAVPDPIGIANQPQSVTIDEGRRVTLSVDLASGSTPITYQWFANGFPVPDGTNRTLFFRSVQQSDTGDYFVEMTNPAGTVDSDVATLTVNPDVTAPTMIAASSLDGSKIKVVWDEVVDQFTGGDAASYDVAGAAVVGAQLIADNLGDSNTVILTVVGLSTSTFDVGVAPGYVVSDPFGNGQSGDPLVSGKVFALGSGLTDDGIVGTAADPLEKGSTTIDINHLDVVAGGSDIWNAADGFRYAYGQYSGDFDLKVRIPRLDPRDNWSKAGFVIREDLTPGSRTLSAIITPHETALDGTGGGANDFEAGMRGAAGGATTDWGGRPTNSFPFTNVWIRVQRSGDTFKAFQGTNGITWSQFATNTTTLPGTLFVGLGTTAHNNGPGQTTTASYENYARILPPTVTTQPLTQNVNEGDLVTFTVAATGEAPFSYQWRKGSVNIPGATSDTYTITSAGPSDDGDYDVIVSNVDSSTFSLMATLSVRLKPRITAHPQSQSVVCGPVTFGVSAAGGPPLSYQWSKDGVEIGGATANTYTINSVSAGDAGSYTVKVSNDIGEATSDPAVLTVVGDSTPPLINCPANISTQCSGPSGTVVNFSASATDNCDPAPAINCVPASGSTFTVGTTSVQCTARDAAGNTSNCGFTVTVQDTATASLTIATDGTTVTITWPQTCSTYTLEAKDSLDEGVEWAAAGGTLSTSGGNNQVTLPLGSANKFFRLHVQ